MRHQVIGIRFNEIDIPQGATITAANIQFTVDELVDRDSASLTIWGQNATGATTFTVHQ